jgi:hypothetical protein
MKNAYFDYFTENLKEKELLQATILGHLVLEYMIVKCLELNGQQINKIQRLSFPAKVDLAISRKIIPANRRNIFLHINNFRNKFAHELDYEPSLNEVHGMIMEAIKDGIDFSDERIADLDVARDEYGIGPCVWELFHNVSSDLFFYLHDRGVHLPC